MTRAIISVFRNFLRLRGKVWLPFLLVVAALMGWIGWDLRDLGLLVNIIIALLLVIATLLDFSAFLILNLGTHFYKYNSITEIYIFDVVREEIYKNIPRALICHEYRSLNATSSHIHQISAISSPVSSAYHEFMRSENSALKWGFNAPALKSSLSINRSIGSFDLLKIVELTGNLVKLRIIFNPPVTVDESPATYSFRREYSGAQFLSKDDIAKAIHMEDISADRPFCIQGRKIETETDRLKIKLEFPSRYNVTNFAPRVTFRGDLVRHIQDKLQVFEERNHKSTTVSLCVNKEHICIGYVYSIVWQPPSLDNIKSSFAEVTNAIS